MRGINVGGNGIIKMADLKTAVEKAGFTGVKTYIQSGNIIFSSAETDTARVEVKLEKTVLSTFKIESPVVAVNRTHLAEILAQAPPEWEKDDLRRYIAFIKAPVTAADIIGDFEVKEGVDSVQAGNGVIYMTTTMEGLTKSKLSKVMGKPSYKLVTMRNYTTAKKMLELMDK